jgi:hypothetical protein
MSIGLVASIIGIFFLIFSIFVFEAWHKDGEERGKDAAQGAFFAIWVLIAFCVGSWAVSWVIMNALNIGGWIANNLHINFIFILLSPIILVFIIALISNSRNRKPPQS